MIRRRPTSCPLRLDPGRDRYGSHMATLADKVGDYPVLFSLLEIFDGEPRCLGSPEATSEENGDHGIVAFAAQILTLEHREESLALFGSQPIPDPHAMLLHALDPPDSCRKIGLRSPQSAASYASREWLQGGG